MGAIVGRQTVFAFKIGATWHTAVQVGADDGVLPLTDGLVAGHTVDKHHDVSLPLPFVQKTNEGLEQIAGDITKNLRYQGDELFLSLVMGDPQTKTGTGPNYDMTILMSTVIEDLFGTWATNLTDDEVVEVPSVKVNGFAISGEMGSPVQLVLNCIGDQLRKTADTGMVNLITDLANVTVADEVKNNRVVMNQRTQFLINDESAIALAAGDELGIQAFALAVNRGMETFAESDSTGSSDSVMIAEPVDNDTPVPTLDLTIPRYAKQNAFLTELKEGGTYKAQLNFYGEIITAAIRYQLTFNFPRLKCMTIAPATGGPGKIPGDVSFAMQQVETLPAGFTDGQPLSIDTVNEKALAPF